MTLLRNPNAEKIVRAVYSFSCTVRCIQRAGFAMEGMGAADSQFRR